MILHRPPTCRHASHEHLPSSRNFAIPVDFGPPAPEPAAAVTIENLERNPIMLRRIQRL